MLTLRPLTAEDHSLLAGWFSSLADVVQWGGSQLSYPLTPLHVETMLSEGRSTPPARRCWMVCRDGAPVGHAQLAYEWHDGNARRVAAARHARPGTGPPVDGADDPGSVQHAGIERLELNVYMFNQPALRTYEALGFKLEGVRRASTRVGEQRWDTGIMGLLRHEWQAGAGQHGVSSLTVERRARPPAV